MHLSVCFVFFFYEDDVRACQILSVPGLEFFIVELVYQLTCIFSSQTDSFVVVSFSSEAIVEIGASSKGTMCLHCASQPLNPSMLRNMTLERSNFRMQQSLPQSDVICASVRSPENERCRFRFPRYVGGGLSQLYLRLTEGS